MTVGIYGIFDSKTDECLYIGMSKNIKERWARHLNLLKTKNHPRKDFVEWYHENGCIHTLLNFRVLETCENDNGILNLLELKWFNLLKPKYFGKKPSLNEKWKHSDETRNKISINATRALFNLKYEKICKVCLNDFISRTHNACYCSEECKYNYCNDKRKDKVKKTKSRDAKIEKQCLRCEKTFLGNKHNFLCIKCKKEKITINLVCMVCKETFQTNKGNKIYCSEKCHSKSFKMNNPDWDAPKSSRFEKMNEEDLNRLYTVENRAIDEICEFFGCKERTIYYHLKNFGIPKRSYIEPNTCNVCGVILKKRKSKNCFEHRYFKIIEE